MKRTWTLLMLAAACAPAWSMNKCTVGGKTVYQDTPCDASSKAETVRDYSTAANPRPYTDARPLRFRPQVVVKEEARRITDAGMAVARAGLKDPESARFSSVRAYRFESMDRIFDVTCGMLNARNSYGGYVGNKPFWVAGGVFTQTLGYIMPEVKGNWTAEKWQAACLADGVTP